MSACAGSTRSSPLRVLDKLSCVLMGCDILFISRSCPPSSSRPVVVRLRAFDDASNVLVFDCDPSLRQLRICWCWIIDAGNREDLSGLAGAVVLLQMPCR